MKSPSIIKLDSLIASANETQANINRKWVPSRPIGFISWRYRVEAAWLVFTGKADAVIWPEDQ